MAETTTEQTIGRHGSWSRDTGCSNGRKIHSTVDFESVWTSRIAWESSRVVFGGSLSNGDTLVVVLLSNRLQMNCLRGGNYYRTDDGTSRELVTEYGMFKRTENSQYSGFLFRSNVKFYSVLYARINTITKYCIVSMYATEHSNGKEIRCTVDFTSVRICVFRENYPVTLSWSSLSHAFYTWEF